MTREMGFKRNLALLACLLCGAFWLAVYAVKIEGRLLRGANDFLQLYAGSRLVGTPQLYDAESAWRIHRQAVGYFLPSVVYTRPPFYAWLLRPLGRLPYRQAYWTFMALNFAAMGWFCWRFFRRHPAAAFLAACFPPLYVAVLVGNDVGLVLGLLGGAVALMEKKRDFAAGLLLSLCAIKFHLFLLLPAALWILGRRRVVAGGAAGGALLTALSFFAQGLAWPRQYLAILRSPTVHPLIERMPNLHGLMLNLLPAYELPATAAASLCVAAAVLWLISRDPRDWKTGLAFTLIGGLLLSWHSYTQDAALLLLVLALLQQSRTTAAVKLPLAIAFLPLTFWMVSSPAPWPTLPAVLMLLTIAGALWNARSARPAANPAVTATDSSPAPANPPALPASSATP